MVWFGRPTIWPISHHRYSSAANMPTLSHCGRKERGGSRHDRASGKTYNPRVKRVLAASFVRFALASWVLWAVGLATIFCRTPHSLQASDFHVGNLKGQAGSTSAQRTTHWRTRLLKCRRGSLWADGRHSQCPQTKYLDPAPRKTSGSHPKRSARAPPGISDTARIYCATKGIGNATYRASVE